MNQKQEFDVTIIGGGVIGCAIARELSAYRLRTCVLEKEEDVCSGTSKANSAIVHAGFDAVPGSLKARFNVEGNAMMEELSRDLDFDFKRNGSLVLCFHEEDREGLNQLLVRGQENGVPDLRVISGEEARQMEPNLSDQVIAALYAPTGGIVCPFGLTIALAENAFDNGVSFLFQTKVESIEKNAGTTEESGYRLMTTAGEIRTKYIVNAAGVYADLFHNMVSEQKRNIIARKGEYCLLDQEAGGHVCHTIFQLPGKMGKGVLVTPTVHGNLLIGPTASDTADREELSTSADGLSQVLEKSALGVNGIPYRQVITSFAGLRAHEEGDDFVIGEVQDAEGFFDAAGMESPGLSCAPAVGVFIAGLVAKKAKAEKKPEFCSKRTGIIRTDRLSQEEWSKLVQKSPAYGTMVCRCEKITEGEIVDAVTRSLGAVSLDGVKRRVRAGMGRCQGGFCTPKVMEIISREKGMPMEEICKNNHSSKMLTGEIQEVSI